MRKRYLPVYLFILFFAMALIPPQARAVDGFLGLKWGMSEEAAKKIFNDFELTDKRSENREIIQPWNSYVRKKETFTLGHLPAEEVSYLFSKDGFDGVIASATFIDHNRSSQPGTYRKLKFKFVSSYAELKNKLISEFGEAVPEESEFGYKCRWEFAQSILTLDLLFEDEREMYINLALSHFYNPDQKLKKDKAGR